MLRKRERKEAGEGKPLQLHYSEPLQSVFAGEEARHPPYDDKAGLERAAASLRRQAKALKAKVSRIKIQTRFDFAKQGYNIHYWVEVLGDANARSAQ